MKIRVFLILALIIFCFGGIVTAQFPTWNIGTAKTLPPLDFRIAAFQPSAIGIVRTVELSAQPLLFFVAPNISMKKQWYLKRIIIATNHGFYYPSYTLKLISKNRIAGLLEKDVNIPQIFAFRNEVLITRELGAKQCTAYLEPEQGVEDKTKNIIFTLKLGVQFALEADESSFRAIEKPVLYQRTAVYQDTTLWYAGFDADGPLYKNINFSADIDLFSVDFKDYAVEHKGMLLFNRNNRFSCLIGYKLSAGTYPDNFRFGIYPLVDFLWYFHRLKVRDGLKDIGL
jgi:hypothetical protein